MLLTQFLVSTCLLASMIAAAAGAAEEVRVLSRVFGPSMLGCWQTQSQFAGPTALSGLQLSDVDAISGLPSVSSVVGVVEHSLEIVAFGSLDRTSSVTDTELLSPDYDPLRLSEPVAAYGVTPSYPSSFGVGLAAGRLFNASDYQQAKPVALVTSELVTELSNGRLDPSQAVGMALLTGQPYEPLTTLTIVGVLRPRSILPGHPHPAAQPQVRTSQPVILVPSRTAGLWDSTRGSDHLTYLWVRVSGAAEDTDGEHVVSLLQSRHAGSEYEFCLKSRQVADEWAATKPVLSVLLIFGLGALILAVLGLAGVTLGLLAQRRAEIGLRWAVGATGSGIVRQIAIEAAIPAVLGGILGALVAMAVMLGIRGFGLLPPPWWAPVLGAFVSIAASVGPSSVYAKAAMTRDASELLKGG